MQFGSTELERGFRHVAFRHSLKPAAIIGMLHLLHALAHWWVAHDAAGSDDRPPLATTLAMTVIGGLVMVGALISVHDNDDAHALSV